MRVIFARTRYRYDSYQDFWRLVELSGFDTCFFDEIDTTAADAVYITTPINGEQLPHLANHPNKRCKIVWWLLERIDDTAVKPVSACLDEALQHMDAAWSSDRLVATHDPRLQFVPLGGHAGLRVHGHEPLQYDYTHQSYAWGRRADVYNRLRSMKLNEGPASFGPERERVLASTRVMLNLQQYTMPVGAPLRFVIAAAYSMPIITESIHTVSEPLQRGDIIEAGYDGIAQVVYDWCTHQDRHEALAEMGRNIHRRYCQETTFRRGVEDGVRTMLERGQP